MNLARDLVCIRDNTTVPADNPICLHPSSLCEFREFCEVIEAIRKKKRTGGVDEGQEA